MRLSQSSSKSKKLQAIIWLFFREHHSMTCNIKASFTSTTPKPHRQQVFVTTWLDCHVALPLQHHDEVLSEFRWSHGYLCNCCFNARHDVAERTHCCIEVRPCLGYFFVQFSKRCPPGRSEDRIHCCTLLAPSLSVTSPIRREESLIPTGVSLRYLHLH